MESLPTEITLQILFQVIDSSTTPDSLYNLLAAFPAAFYTFAAHRRSLLGRHVSNLKATVEDNTKRLLDLAEADAGKITFSSTRIYTICLRNRWLETTLRMARDPAIPTRDRNRVWDVLDSEMRKLERRKRLFNFPAGEIAEMRGLIAETKVGCDQVERWERFAQKFAESRMLGRRGDKWATERRRAFFGLARRSPRA